MLAKILHFTRSSTRSLPVPAGPDPDTVTADHPIVADLLGTAGLEETEEKDRRSTIEQTRHFLDILMGEAAHLYAIDGRDPPQSLKLDVVHKRYVQLMKSGGYPYQDKSQLSKHLVALGCRSDRVTINGKKLRVVVFPAYPAARFK
jgi:hypothetical protein